MSQTSPLPQESQVSGAQLGWQVPVAKTHSSSSAQSECCSHRTDGPLEVELLVPPPLPPSGSVNVTMPPQPTNSSAATILTSVPLARTARRDHGAECYPPTPSGVVSGRPRRPRRCLIMLARSSILRRFQEARLDLVLLDEPIARGRSAASTRDIVQIDIDKPRGRERFRIYPGAADNRVEVLGVDRPHQQLVLFVEEAARRFTTRVPRSTKPPRGARVVAEDATSRTIEQVTSAEKRHFLCGMDEQHLFIAQLPHGASSVHAARDALRAPEVPPAFVNRRHDVVRQGEWFFLSAKSAEVAEVEAALARGRVQRRVGIAEAARIARAGRPHVADEVVVLPPEGSSATPRIYVRGDVKHPDHRTVYFPTFRRTVPNRERSSQPAGVYWID